MIFERPELHRDVSCPVLVLHGLVKEDDLVLPFVAHPRRAPEELGELERGPGQAGHDEEDAAAVLNQGVGGEVQAAPLLLGDEEDGVGLRALDGELVHGTLHLGAVHSMEVDHREAPLEQETLKLLRTLRDYDDNWHGRGVPSRCDCYSLSKICQCAVDRSAVVYRLMLLPNLLVEVDVGPGQRLLDELNVIRLELRPAQCNNGGTLR